MNDVIISGLVIRPQNYIQTVKGIRSENATEDEESTEEQVAEFLESKNIVIHKENIEACHTLPIMNQKVNSDMPAIIIHFANRNHKIDLPKTEKEIERFK